MFAVRPIDLPKLEESLPIPSWLGGETQRVVPAFVAAPDRPSTRSSRHSAAEPATEAVPEPRLGQWPVGELVPALKRASPAVRGAVLVQVPEPWRSRLVRQVGEPVQWPARAAPMSLVLELIDGLMSPDCAEGADGPSVADSTRARTGDFEPSASGVEGDG